MSPFATQLIRNGQMRRFLRHPSRIPIAIETDAPGHPDRHALIDVSTGGLSFASTVELPIDALLRIRIDLVEPPFEARARVVWCHREGESFDVGVELEDGTDVRFRTRMVEQICHIEDFRREILDREGRNLSSEEAAREWIRVYAADFPGLEIPAPDVE